MHGLMASFTGCVEVNRIQRGAWIVSFQRVVSSMTIGTAGNTLRISNLQNFAVIRLVISVGHRRG